MLTRPLFGWGQLTLVSREGGRVISTSPALPVLAYTPPQPGVRPAMRANEGGPNRAGRRRPEESALTAVLGTAQAPDLDDPGLPEMAGGGGAAAADPAVVAAWGVILAPAAAAAPPAVAATPPPATPPAAAARRSPRIAPGLPEMAAAACARRPKVNREQLVLAARVRRRDPAIWMDGNKLQPWFSRGTASDRFNNKQCAAVDPLYVPGDHSSSPPCSHEADSSHAETSFATLRSTRRREMTAAERADSSSGDPYQVPITVERIEPLVAATPAVAAEFTMTVQIRHIQQPLYWVRQEVALRLGYPGGGALIELSFEALEPGFADRVVLTGALVPIHCAALHARFVQPVVCPGFAWRCGPERLALQLDRDGVRPANAWLAGLLGSTERLDFVTRSLVILLSADSRVASWRTVSPELLTEICGEHGLHAERAEELLSNWDRAVKLPRGLEIDNTRPCDVCHVNAQAKVVLAIVTETVAGGWEFHPAGVSAEEAARQLAAKVAAEAAAGEPAPKRHRGGGDTVRVP